MGQSSNDVFPSAIHLAAVTLAENEVLPALAGMEPQLKKLETELAREEHILPSDELETILDLRRQT